MTFRSLARLFTRFSITLDAVLSVALIPSTNAEPLAVRQDENAQTLTVYRVVGAAPVLTQNAGAEFRPYIHPIIAPDGKGVLTEVSPDHHRHQTGLYWGITHLNGRDYFHNLGQGYWRRVSSRVLVQQGEEVKWTTSYHLLDVEGRPAMLETQVWSMRDAGDHYTVDLEWTGQALTDLTIGEHAYGGLFLRMPWRPGLEANATNSNRQRNERADGQRAAWVDVGLKVEGRDSLAHIALFDHPLNDGYPLPWRVDRQFGVGPSRAALGEWKIEKGKSSTYRHRCVIYTGAFNDMKLEEARRAYTGETNEKTAWILARDEAKQAKFLTGEQAVAKMTPAPGFEVKLYASEPAIEQPIAFCWDDRGRLWVAENRDYETRKTGFSASGDSRVVILEDTDGDGKMDTRKVFLEGIVFPSGMAVGFNGLWLGAPPNLLFIPDRDHDDKADREIEVRLTGWGIQDRHETINSLTWGPDGWLYGCQGYATRSRVGKPADGGRVYRVGETFPENPPVKDPQYLDGGLWRYHPTKDRFEIVAHGLSNPWGIDFDDHGQMFVTACVIPHLWHIIPGGLYQRQGGKHINPHAYVDIQTIADHRHRSAHGGARIYLADEFPRDYRGRLFMANIHERALLTDILEPRGSGFVGRHGDEALLANDPQWVGFSVEIGPDGAVYILDWHDADICGISVHDKATGRIFRFAPKGLPGKTGLDLAKQSDLDLVELQAHHNDWFVRRARVLLQQRAAEGRLDSNVAIRLWDLFERAESVPVKLRALWALHVTGSLTSNRLIELLDHPAAHVRAWAVQLLCEDGAPAPAVIGKFATQAKGDRSPIVRLYLASALQRLPVAQRWDIGEGLLAHAEDERDPNLPTLVWLGVEPLVTQDPDRALALAAHGAIPSMTRFIARRAVAAQRLESVAATLAQALGADTRQALLEGMRDGLNSLGRRERRAPKAWPAAEAALSADGSAPLRGLLTQINQLLGDAQAAETQLAALRDPSEPLARRREILQSFARDGFEAALPEAIALLDDANLRRDAIRALAAFEDARAPKEILQRYAKWTASEKADAILALSARRSSAEALFSALTRSTVPKRDVSAFAARQLQRVLGPAFVDFWGPITQPAEGRLAEIADLKRTLTDEKLALADLSNGRALFERTCSGCHSLYGQGGMIGPDLTGSNRANLDYILAEIINPSDVIQEGYHLVTVITRDGRTLAGNLASEDEHQITLRMIGQDTVVAKSEIQSREISPVSMMPEGLLKLFSEDEIRDLVGYLRTVRQVPSKS